MKTILLLWAALLLLTTKSQAQFDDTNQINQAMRLARGLKYQQGEIDLRGGLAKLTVPKEFNYLNPDDTETVLVKLWQNPPEGHKTLGLLMPAGLTPFSPNCWVVIIDYSEAGFVKDNDAGKINYDDLLKEMKGEVAKANEERKKQNYPTVELLGWAAPPRYDTNTHKLYWAKKLRFEDSKEDTLNYNIRMLGRRGVLELNAIARVDQLPEIDAKTPQILGMVDFNEGSRYADFDPKTDKVATIGIAALVAGGVIAAKLGFFKLIWVALIAAKKFILIGAIALASFFKKSYKRLFKKSE